VIREIIDTIETNPKMFHTMNKGVTVAVNKINVSKKGAVTVEFDEEDFFGTLDGGHTLATLDYCLDSQDELLSRAARKVYINVTIMVGFSVEDLIMVSGARNTAISQQETGKTHQKGAWTKLFTGLPKDLKRRIQVKPNGPGFYQPKRGLLIENAFNPEGEQTTTGDSSLQRKLCKDMELPIGERKTRVDLIPLLLKVEKVICLEAIKEAKSLGKKLMRGRGIRNLIQHDANFQLEMSIPSSLILSVFRALGTRFEGNKFTLKEATPVTKALVRKAVSDCLQHNEGNWTQWSRNQEAQFHLCLHSMKKW
jgi:hypothetical protein